MNDNIDTIFFITGNHYKFNEVSKLFQREILNYELKQLNIDPIEIQADNINKVALFKLNSVKEKVTASFFTEDAGFFVDEPLNGFPGVYSSFVFKTIGNEGILKLIQNHEKTKAHFTSIIALYFKPLDKNFFFEGNVQGKISKTIRGFRGFGFDPIFLPNDLPNKTFEELIGIKIS